MNFCVRCQSYYQQPGTCNCFAPARDAPAAVTLRQPCPVCGDWDCVATHIICAATATEVA